MLSDQTDSNPLLRSKHGIVSKRTAHLSLYFTAWPGNMAHVRRRSSSRVVPSPALGHPAYSDVLPSPFIGRTPEWSAQTTGVGVGSRPPKQGWIDSSKSPRPAAQKSSAISRPGADALPPLRDVVVRFLSILLRLLRTPQGLVIAATTIVLCSTSAYVRAHSDELAARPVHPSLFPLIRHSGNVVHFVSPKLGARIKDWHDYQVENDPNRPPSREELERSSRHTFHPNGLLLVNPKGRHPIHVLIDRAEKKWKEKVERQSRTLSEAVREYKHRYRRNPPKGFDDWYVKGLWHETRWYRFPDLLDGMFRWRFCEENNVQLRDEYDQINHDLAPHWAL